MKIINRFIAVDNACLWPQLRVDNNGNILMTGFNKPCHGKTTGDVDCYISTDGGNFFDYAGTPVVHEAGSNRMNHVSGFAHNGDFLNIVSGYTNRPEVEYEYDVYLKEYFYKSELAVPMLSRSSDNGKTYTVSPLENIFNSEWIIPYGEIVKLEKDVLAASIYVLGTNKAKEFDNCTRRAGVLISRDDGETWNEFYEIDKGINETSILYLGNNTLLAVARTAENQRLKLYKSINSGKDWIF